MDEHFDTVVIGGGQAGLAMGYQLQRRGIPFVILEAYAARFELPIRGGTRVDGLTRQDGRFVLTAGDDRHTADRVVVATGAFNTPWVPSFAADLDPRIVQLHAGEYRI